MPNFVAQEEMPDCVPSTISSAQRKACLQWVAISHFDLFGPPGKAIEINLRWFCQEKPLHNIYTAVGNLFTVTSGTVERWPRILEALFCQGRHDSDASFETWERPRDLDKHRRAVFVWSSMLAFIVAHWTYDADILENMELLLSEDLKSAIDDISYWCKTGDNVGRISAAAKHIFMKAIMDSNPWPGTNPMLWWLAVIIKSHLLDSKPEFPIGGIDKHSVPALSFDCQLEALNHYARVMTLESLIHELGPSETANRAFNGDLRRTKNEIHGLVCNNSDHWFDESNDRAFQRLLDEKFHMDSPAWQHIRKLPYSLDHDWLAHDCHGPVREILGLLNGELVRRGDERRQDLVLSGTQPASSPQVDQYHVVIQCWTTYMERQGGQGREPSRPNKASPVSQRVYNSASEANEEARTAIETEFGPRSYTQRWDKHLRDDGTVQIRAVYAARNVKVVAWVKKQRAFHDF